MRHLTFLLGTVMVLFAITGCSQAQEPHTTPLAQTGVPGNAYAVVDFGNPVIDFGKVAFGRPLTVRFHFRNVSNMPLIIQKVPNSNSNFIPSWPKDTIMPGIGGVIEGTYQANYVGRFHKTITVIANTDPPHHQLVFKGEVLKPDEKIPGRRADLKWDKTEHDFGEIEQGTQQNAVFTYTNVGDTALIIENVKSSCGCMVGWWDKKPVPPGEQGVIKVNYNSRGQRGPFNKSLTVIGANTYTKVYVLRVKGKVMPLEAPPDHTPYKPKTIINE